MTYITSYDTLGNYEDASPITEAIASPSQLEREANVQVPPLPRQSRRIPTWKKVLIGGIVLGSLAGIGYKALDIYAKSIVGSGFFIGGVSEKDQELIESWQMWGNRWQNRHSYPETDEEIRKRNERRKSRY